MRTSLRRSRRQVNAAGSAPAFDPATLALTGWWRANYAGSPWAGTASAGVSGSNSLTEATNPPTTGTAVNGFTPASFGTTKLLTAGGTIDTYINAKAVSFWMLLNLTSLVDSVQLIGDFNEGMLLVVTGGVMSLQLNAGAANVTRAIAAGAYHLVTGRYDGVNAQIGVDEAPGAAGGASSAAFSTNIASLTDPLRLGVSTAIPSEGLNGSALELGISDQVLSNADFANVKAFINSRYGLSL